MDEKMIRLNEIIEIAKKISFRKLVFILSDTDVDFQTRINKALVVAAKSGKVKIVDLLIKIGADVSFNDNSALMSVSGKKKPRFYEVAKLLISAGANASARNNAPFMQAVKYGREKTVELMINSGVDVNANPEIIIAAIPHIRVLKILIDNGADVTVNDNEAIKYASKWGLFRQMEMLITAGADVTAEENISLYYAILRGEKRGVEILVDAGADINSRNNLPIREASWRNYTSDILEYLIEKGANVNANDYEPPIILAAMQCNLRNVKILVHNGADVTVRNNAPIRWASLNTSYLAQDVVDFLIENGADATAKDNEAIILASSEGNSEVVDVLIKKGKVDVTARNNAAIKKALKKGFKKNRLKPNYKETIKLLKLAGAKNS